MAILNSVFPALKPQKTYENFLYVKMFLCEHFFLKKYKLQFHFLDFAANVKHCFARKYETLNANEIELR